MKAGVDLALNMRQMFIDDKRWGVSLDIEWPDVIVLRAHPFNGLYYERSMITYRFSPDGLVTGKVTNS